MQTIGNSSLRWLNSLLQHSQLPLRDRYTSRGMSASLVCDVGRRNRQAYLLLAADDPARCYHECRGSDRLIVVMKALENVCRHLIRIGSRKHNNTYILTDALVDQNLLYTLCTHLDLWLLCNGNSTVSSPVKENACLILRFWIPIDQPICQPNVI